MSVDNNSSFLVPREAEPSRLRRMFRRTLYLRLLDGEFILWCFETGRTARHSSELLRHERVVISDTQAFKDALLNAMNEVGVGSVPGRRRVLLLHSLRSLPGGLSPTEKYALYEMWRRLGSEFFVIPAGPKKLTDPEIVTFCQEVGAPDRHLRKVQAN